MKIRRPCFILLVIFFWVSKPVSNASGIDQSQKKSASSLQLPALIPYRDGKLWGYADRTGIIRIKPQFHSAELFSNGFAIVNINGTEMNLIDMHGVFQLPGHYKKVNQVNENMVLAKNQDDLVGLYTISGFEILAPKQLDITVNPIKYPDSRKEELYLVYTWLKNKNEEKEIYSGIINGEGIPIIPFNRIEITYKGEGIIKIDKDGERKFYNLRGEAIGGLNGFEVGDFNEGLAMIVKDSLRGFADTSGNVIVPVKYSWACNFTNDVTMVGLNNKIGFINKKGEEVVPPIYDKVDLIGYGAGYATIGNKIGLIDFTGNQLTEIKYDNIRMFELGKYYTFYEKGKKPSFGIISLKSGKPVLTTITEMKFDFSRFEGEAIEGESAKYFLPDKSNPPIIRLPKFRFYTKRVHIFRKRIKVPKIRFYKLRIYRNRLTGLINDEWKIVIPAIYEDVNALKFGLAAVKMKSNWGVVNESNKLIIPPQYSYIDILDKDLVRVTKSDGGNYNYGIFNRKGEVIIPPNYHLIFYYEDGQFVLVQRNDLGTEDKVGLADKSGKIIIPLFSPPEGYKISYHQNFRNGLIQARLTEKKAAELKIKDLNPYNYWGYVDRYGRAYFND